MSKWVKRGKLKTRNFDSKFLIYDCAQGTVLELNESAKLIWIWLDDLCIEEVIEKYAEYYGLEISVAADDVNLVIEELEEKGLIRRGGVD